MYSRNDIVDLRLLTENILDDAEKSLLCLMDSEICSRDFEVISIALASRLNYLGCIYEELADNVGTIRIGDRGTSSPALFSAAVKEYIFR